ncbi:MAG TPA: LemA family protein [Dehalococcoidales bacterium]|nr:LemA family protein [Dehalococcoidales bacterium]
MIPIIIAGVLALACLVSAYWFLRRKRLINDTPTSKALGVFIGLVELKGAAESDAPFTGRLSGAKCVLYNWRVDEHWTRIVTTTSTDGKGHTTTTTHTESGWTTVAHGGEEAPFYLQDDTGVIRIQPEGAKIESRELYDKTVGMLDPLYYGKGPAGSVANSDHRRRFVETGIPLHAQLYVMGQARERQDAVAAEVARDKKAPLFLISVHTEKQVSAEQGWGVWVFFFLGLVLAPLGVLVANLINKPVAALWPPYVIAGGAYLVAAALGWMWTVFNSLVGLRQRTRQAWGEVDIQLKRRADLIPNLVNVVEGYSVHEKGTQELLTALRGQVSAGTNISGLAPSLRVALEQYPDLKASEQFLNLQKELAETEERIALARDYFNNIATFYNGRLQIIPDTFIGKMAGFKAENLMTATALERAAIKVSLVS